MLRPRTIQAAMLAAVMLMHPYRPHAEVVDVDEPDGGPVAAIWRVHQVDLVYHSLNVYYACDSLGEKIGDILRALGAHRRMAVKIRCGRREFVNNTVARITFAAPTEATQDAVDRATTFDARTRLAARVRRIRLPTPADIKRFPAEWRTVSLTADRNLRLGPGDCDLLRAMGEHVFPRISVRIDKSNLRCFGPATRFGPLLQISALMPAPLPDGESGSGSALERR